MQAALLMFVFEQRLSFRMLENVGWGLKLRNSFMSASWVQGVKALKHFGLFTSRGQINSLKWKKLCKPIYI